MCSHQVAQPKGWITVGLRGAFEDNVTVSGEIVDEDGVTMEACSRFALRRADDDSVSGYTLVGEWVGVYHCGGTPTRLLLKLAADHPKFPGEIRGTFEFAVLNDLDTDELHELANIVSDSLLDIGDTVLADSDLNDLKVVIVDVNGDEIDLDSLDDDDLEIIDDRRPAPSSSSSSEDDDDDDDNDER